MKLFTVFITLFFVFAAFAAGDALKLPSRDSATVIPLLKKLEGRPEIKQVEAILGRHDREVGSGRCIFIYVLQDQSEVSVNTGDCEHIDWISRTREGQRDEMLFETKTKPNKAPQTTAITPPPSATPLAPLSGL